ncbi:MAG: DUF1320 domain-containing protein [Oxalobacter sp.]|nr:MAG: DUF1320 domain-containing protein [Oxalobacter sp.]
MWIDASGLTARFGAEEIAQRADRGVPRLVSAEMLIVLIAGGDMSAFTQEEQTATQRALLVIETAIADANSVVNGYLAGRYKLPITPVPLSVQRFAGDIARYMIYDDQATDTIQKRYDAAIKVLGDISRGVVNLGDQSSAQPTPTGGAVRIESGGSVWRRDQGGFI